MVLVIVEQLSLAQSIINRIFIFSKFPAFYILWKFIKGSLTKRSQEASRDNSQDLPLSQLQIQKEDTDFAGGYYFVTSAGVKKIFSFPGNGPANEGPSQLNQWEANILQTASLLQWTFCSTDPN